VLLVTAALALQAVATDKPLRACERAPVIRMALTTEAPQAAIAARATTPSGHVLAIMRDTDGWEVTVHRVGAKNPDDSLLYPKGPWHGAFPCQVQPGGAFPDLRYIPVRGTDHHVCVRLVEATVKDGALGTSRFTGGWLEISWEPEPTGRARLRPADEDK
jgi:hypothetical protein